jgi:hypothetical protein
MKKWLFLKLNFNKELLLVFIVSALALFLRFYRIEHTFSFMYDQARDLEAVRTMIEERKPTLLGPQTSVGIFTGRETYFGPLHYYLVLLPFALFNQDPLAPIVFTGITNVLSGIFLYLLLQRLTKNRWLPGVVFTLYLLSPVSLQYSRFYWNPNFLPLFVSLAYFCFWLFLEKKKAFWLLATGLWTGFCFQLHYVALPLFLGFLPFFFNKKEACKSVKRFAFYLLGFLGGILPIIVFELRHKFFITSSIIYHFTSETAGKSFAFSFPLIWEYLVAMSQKIFGFANVSLDPSVNLVTVALIPAALLVIFWFGLRVGETANKKVLVRASFINVFLGTVFAVMWSSIGRPRLEDRYYLPIIIPFLLIIFCVVERFLKKGLFRLARQTMGKLATVFLAVALLFSLRQDLLIVREEIGIDQFKVNYLGAREIAGLIARDVETNHLQGQYNVANIVDGSTRAYYYRYFLKDKDPLGVELYPQAKVLYVVARGDEAFVANYPVWEISSFEKKQLADSWPGPFGITVYKFVKQDFKQNTN